MGRDWHGNGSDEEGYELPGGEDLCEAGKQVFPPWRGLNLMGLMITLCARDPRATFESLLHLESETESE